MAFFAAKQSFRNIQGIRFGKQLALISTVLWSVLSAYLLLSEIHDNAEEGGLLVLLKNRVMSAICVFTDCSNKEDFSIDKIVHFVLFMGFAFLYAHTHKLFFPTLRYTHLVFSASVSALWAVSSEWLQGTYLLTRSADTLDIAADMLGALAGIIVCIILHRYANKKSEKII